MIGPISALLAVGLLAAGCGDHDNRVYSTEGKPAPGIEEAGGPRLDRLDDLDPAELIGMGMNQLDKRLYSAAHAFSPLGDGWIRDFGGVSFSIELLGLTALLAPGRDARASGYMDDFTVVSACSRYLPAEDAYALYLGLIERPLSTPEILADARSGQFDDIMRRNTGCEPSGPTIPLSRMS